MGAIIFPGSEFDITAACRPEAAHVLSMFVVAMPLKGAMLSYSETASAREVTGSVVRRGLATFGVALKWYRRNGSQLKLVCLVQRVRNIFEMSRLESVFQIYDSEAEALS